MQYRSFIALMATAIAFGLLPLVSHADVLYTDAADAEYGGPMTLAGAAPVYTAGQLVFSLTADNTGATTLPDIMLDTQFVWDSSTGTAVKLNYSSSTSTWTNANPDNFSIASVTGGSLGLLPWNETNAPPSATPIIGGDMASVSPTDIVPSIDLGSFTPGQMKTFTIKANANNFSPTVGGYFLEPVPEPSTFALLGTSAVALFAWKLRRRLRLAPYAS